MGEETAEEWGWLGLMGLKSGRTLYAHITMDRTDLYSEVGMIFQMGDGLENKRTGDKQVIQGACEVT